MDRKNLPDATRHLLRVAMGKIERRAARGRINNSVMPILSEPLMPVLPWNQTEATRDETTGNSDE